MQLQWSRDDHLLFHDAEAYEGDDDDDDVPSHSFPRNGVPLVIKRSFIVSASMYPFFSRSKTYCENHKNITQVESCELLHRPKQISTCLALLEKPRAVFRPYQARIHGYIELQAFSFQISRK